MSCRRLALRRVNEETDAAELAGPRVDASSRMGRTSGALSSGVLGEGLEAMAVSWS